MKIVLTDFVILFILVFFRNDFFNIFDIRKKALLPNLPEMIPSDYKQLLRYFYTIIKLNENKINFRIWRTNSNV